MTTMANPPHDISQHAFQRDYPAVRSPDYSTVSARADDMIKSSTQHISHISPRNRSDLTERYAKQPYHNQIRPMKGPLYVPAVLRPTEKPIRQSPPRRAESSRPDDSWGDIVGAEVISSSPPSSIMSPIGGRTGVTSLTTEEMNEINKEPVTGLPSTNHWKPDSAVATCNAKNCNNQFGLFVRRHHCRRCGNIFCWQHSSNQAPLNQHALFHPGGSSSRVCDRCFSCYNEWETRRTSRTNSESSGSSGTQPMHIRVDSVSSAPQASTGDAAFEPGSLAPGADAHGPKGEGFKPKSFVTSIPNHWNWSTF